MKHEALKPCPCGQTPTKLHISETQCSPKWALVAGNCCDEWHIEFRTIKYDMGSDVTYEAAIEAWNDAPRGYK